MNQTPPHESLAQMVADAYGRIAGDPNAAQKPATDAVAQAYAGIPSSQALKRFDQLEAARGHTAEGYASVQPRSLLPLFNPMSAPFKGMFSALVPSALQPGQFSLVQDLRPDDGSLRARQPTTNRIATGLPGAASSARGLWAGSLNGTYYVVGAWYDGAKVGIYYSTNGTAFSTATQTTGAYNDTRLADPGRPLSFCAATNPSDGLDYLVIQNGTDAPRVFIPAGINGSKVAVLKQYAPPTWASTTPIVGVLFQTLTQNQIGAVGAVATTGANISAAIVSSQVAITIGTGMAAGATCTMSGLGGLSLTTAQMIIVSDQASQNAWFQWKVEAQVTGGTWVTLCDPTSATYYAPVRVPWVSSAFQNSPSTGGFGGEEIVGIPLSSIQAGTLTGITAYRLTWTGGTVGTGYTTTLHGIFQSGSSLAFGQTWSISYTGVNGMSETPAAIYGEPSPLTPTQLLGTNFPYVAGIYYDHILMINDPPLADVQKGLDWAYIYKQDLGGGDSSDFFYQFSVPVGKYNLGAWEYIDTGTTTPSTFPQQRLFDASQPAVDISRYAPDGFALVMPVGSCLASANGRLLVGGQGFYSVSEYAQPFRFRLQLLFDNGSPVERSATRVTFPGQTVQAFATPSGSALSANTVFIWTEKRTYAAGGFDGYSLSRPTCVAEIGCSAPGSVVQYKDAIFFLDGDLQVRRFSYGHSFLYGYTNANGYQLFAPIGRRVIDDRTKAIAKSRLPWVTGAATFDRYYLGYTPSGGSANTRILVWDELIGCWVEDTVSLGLESLAYADLSSGRLLLGAGEDGNLYTHEDPGSSLTHTVRLTSGEIHHEMWLASFYGRVGMVADVQSGQSCAVAKAIKPNVTDASTIDLATSAVGQVWRWDSRSSSTQPGQKGVSCQVDLQMTMTPGTRVYSLVMETGTCLPGADQL